jgi:hypothetical protein
MDALMLSEQWQAFAPQNHIAAHHEYADQHQD